MAVKGISQYQTRTDEHCPGSGQHADPDTMTPAEFPVRYGTCPICGMSQRVTQDGRLHKHNG